MFYDDPSHKPRPVTLNKSTLRRIITKFEERKEDETKPINYALYSASNQLIDAVNQELSGKSVLDAEEFQEILDRHFYAIGMELFGLKTPSTSAIEVAVEAAKAGSQQYRELVNARISSDGIIDPNSYADKKPEIDAEFRIRMQASGEDVDAEIANYMRSWRYEYLHYFHESLALDGKNAQPGTASIGF